MLRIFGDDMADDRWSLTVKIIIIFQLQAILNCKLFSVTIDLQTILNLSSITIDPQSILDYNQIEDIRSDPVQQADKAHRWAKKIDGRLIHGTCIKRLS